MLFFFIFFFIQNRIPCCMLDSFDSFACSPTKTLINFNLRTVFSVRLSASNKLSLLILTGNIVLSVVEIMIVNYLSLKNGKQLIMQINSQPSFVMTFNKEKNLLFSFTIRFLEQLFIEHFFLLLRTEFFIFQWAMTSTSFNCEKNMVRWKQNRNFELITP